MAENVATTADRIFLTARLGMPGSFRPLARTPRATYALSVRMSTIAKHSGAGGGTLFARALGAEVRRLRLALGLSQAAVGKPLSRAFLSAVEAGRVLPSIPSLVMIAQRLNTTAAAILASVERHLEAQANIGPGDQTPLPRPG